MKRRIAVSAVLIFAAVFALFAPSIGPGHLSLDDWGYVNGCPFVKDGLSPRNVLSAFATVGHGGIWMPLTSIGYMATISLFGDGWTAHHVISVLLHSLNACLVFFLFLKTIRFLKPTSAWAVPACAVAALIWACNPCRAEAVAWVASRKEEMWTLFAVLSLLRWISWMEFRRRIDYAFSFAFFVMACLSKPTAMCMPAVAFAFSLMAPEGMRRPRLKEYLPMVAVSVATGAIALYAQAHPAGMAPVDIAPSSFGWRAFNALVSCGIYLIHVVAPYGVHADWRLVENGWPVRGAAGLASVAALAACSAAMLWFCRDKTLRKAALAAGVWFFAALAPVLGVFGQAGDDAIAGRWSYMPALAPAMLAAVAVSSLERSAWKAVACLGAFAAVSAAASVPCTLSYASDKSLAERTLSFDPENWRALRTLGRIKAAGGAEMDEGIGMLRKSLSIRPSKLTADALAYVLACRGGEGDFAEVRRICRAAARNASRDPGGMMLDALGIVAMREGDDASAAKFFSSSLVAPQRTYSNVHTILNLGLALANSGKRADAVLMLLRLHSVPETEVRKRAREAIEAIRDRKPGRFEWR